MNRVPLVAIVGRPNVGKSTLFNRIAGHRLAIVEDTPGVTRDRLYADAEWYGRRFAIVDTGGYEPRAEERIYVGMREQARLAMEEADVICLVVDGAAGLLPGDEEIVSLVRRSSRPLVLVVNKIDGQRQEMVVADFYSLGLDDLFPVSAAHGRGVGDLVDRLLELLPVVTQAEIEAEEEAERLLDFAWGDDDDDTWEGEETPGEPLPETDEDDLDDLDDLDDAQDAEDELDDADTEGQDAEDEDEDAGDDLGDLGDLDELEDAERGEELAAEDGGDLADEDADDAGEAEIAGGEPRPGIATGQQAPVAGVAAEAPVLREIRVSFIGRPNVGKSTLVNRILGQDRCLVSNEPGTTRDPVDTEFVRGERRYRLIDTAGLRRKSRIKLDLERYTAVRSLRAIDRSHVVCFLLDAIEGISDQDLRIATYARKQGRAAIILLNKWDLLDGRDHRTLDTMIRQLREDYTFLPYAPVLPVSAKTGRGVERVLATVDKVRLQHLTRVPTGPLNRLFQQITKAHHPPMWRGKLVKLFYITQTAVAPPTFMISCNHPDGVPETYRRYIENHLREQYPFSGTPLRLDFQQRGEAPDDDRRRPRTSHRTQQSHHTRK